MYTRERFDAFIAKQKYPPNPFQLQVLESVAFGTGNIVVSALAGSGKTTLLVQIASLMADMGISGEQVLFMAFNVKIADELNERLPKGFSAINSHKIGNRALGTPKPKLSYTKTRNIAEELVNGAFDVNTYTQSQRFSAQRTLEDLTSKVMLSLTDPKDTLAIRALAAHHGMFDGDNFSEDVNIIPLIVSLVPQMISKMERVFENTREVNFDEMLYLPVKRNLIKPSFDWVLVDECQDLNAAQQEIVFQSIKSGGRIIFVGDVNQCVIEGTQILTPSGAVPVETLQEYDTVLAGAGRGYIVNAGIEAKEQRHVEGADVVTITTSSGKQLTTTFGHMHFAGYLFGHGELNPYVMYLMYRKDMGYRVGISRKLPKGAKHLGYMGRCNGESCDLMWILDTFETELEARIAEHIIAARYELPTIMFKARDGYENMRSSIPQDAIDTIFSSLDTHAAAQQILADYGMSKEHPHHIPKAMHKENHFNLAITFGADFRGGKNARTLHLLEIGGNDPEPAKVLKSLGFKVTDNGKASGWRVRQYSQSAAILHDQARKIEQHLSVTVIKRFNVDQRYGKSLPFCPASHLRVGMMIAVADEGKISLDEITHVQMHKYTGYVHEMDVQHLHNYIANDIVTHNSIYGFAGADAYAFDNLIERSDGQLLPLNICYRCPSSHLQYARAIVPDILPRDNAPFGEIKFIDDEAIPELAQPGNLIMSRVTAPLVKFYFELIRARKPAQVLGRDIGGDLIKTLDKVAKRPDFQFDSLNHFLDVYKNEQLNSLRQRENSANAVQVLKDKIETLQTCVTEFACPDMPMLKRNLSKLFGTGRGEEEERESKRADLITLLTVHRAKGLEADVTFIVKPEKMPLKWEGQHAWQLAQEMNILYVALTRAKKVMHIAGVLAVHPHALEGETLAPVSTAAKDTATPFTLATESALVPTPQEEEPITHAPTPAEAPLLPAAPVVESQPAAAPQRQLSLGLRCKIASGRTDLGAEHRAIMIASALQTAKLWDGIGDIWFHDAYAIHSAHYSVDSLPLHALVLEQHPEGMHVSLPKQPDAHPTPEADENPSEALILAPNAETGHIAPEIAETPLYEHPCGYCSGTGEVGDFACDECDGSGYHMLPYPYEESDEEGTLITDDTALPAELHSVRAHLRALPPGKRASRRARALASKHGINLAEFPGYTFVSPHERIDDDPMPAPQLPMLEAPMPDEAPEKPRIPVLSPKPIEEVLAPLALATKMGVLLDFDDDDARPEAKPKAETLINALLDIDTDTLDTFLDVLQQVKRIKTVRQQQAAAV